MWAQNYEIIKSFEKFHPSYRFTKAHKGGPTTAYRGGLKIAKLFEKFLPLYRFT